MQKQIEAKTNINEHDIKTHQSASQCVCVCVSCAATTIQFRVLNNISVNDVTKAFEPSTNETGMASHKRNGIM